MRKMRPVANDPATEYALKVIDAKIVAGELVREACKRHLRDLEQGSKRGLQFDADKAKYHCGFFPAVLTVTEGVAAGKPFNLLTWHEFVVASLFGWRREDNSRRFRMAWLETGKGQAKSPLMAGLGLNMLGFDGKKRAEIYAIAGDRDQANVLFKDAVAMCRANMPERDEDEFESLESEGEVVIRGTGDNAWKIEHPATGSKFQSMASVDSISGPRPYAVLADEIHEFKNDYALQTWKAAIDKMSGDPVMILGTNTPATNQLVGTEYSEMFQKVVTGQADDDSLFGYIARVDKEDHETIFENEKAWVKSLPALGITYPIENIRSRVTTSKLMISQALSTKRLYFGIPVGSETFWCDQVAWDSCQGRVDQSKMKGKCWLSLDLSKKNDLTAVSAAFVNPDGKEYVKTWYFTTKKNIADRSKKDNAPYDAWAARGLIEAVPGATISYKYVARHIKQMCSTYDVQFLAFDAAKIGDFIDACTEIDFPVWKFQGPDKPAGKGLKLVAHGQGTRIVFTERALCMPKSIEQLEDGILNGTVVIDHSPVTTMCASNAIVITDTMNNRAYDKKKSRGRIDGLVSIAMAIGAARNEFAPLKREYKLVVVG